MKRSELKDRRHWVVKIGSGVLLRDKVHVDRPTFVNLVLDIVSLVELGHRVTVVSSGAVALGRQVASEQRKDLPSLQAYAALGQARLIQMFDLEFAQYGKRAAQILLGRGDIDRRESFLNARMALEAVDEFGAIPVINENDTVATEGLRFDDNDHLAAITCGLVQADLLVILSDVEGVLEVSDGPSGRVFGGRISTIGVEDDSLRAIAGPSVSGHGKGGMNSKVSSARHAARFGVPTVIAGGKIPRILQTIRRGDDAGTLLVPTQEHLQGKKIWIGAAAVSVGKISCDPGACRALKERGASLLPKGILRVDGEWDIGSVVDVCDPEGKVFARGLCSYSASDLRKISGVHSEKFEEILGHRGFEEAIHRDNLVLT